MPYKVTYPGGQVVTFENEPTESDIDEIAASFGTSQREIPPEASDAKLYNRRDSRNTTLGEDVRGSAMNTVSPFLSIGHTADALVAQGLAGLGVPGAQEEADKAHERRLNVLRTQERLNPTYGKNRGAGELLEIPGAFASLMGPQAIPYVLGNVAERGQRSLDQGASVNQATTEAIASGIITAGSRALPGAVGVGGKTGATTGAVMGAVTTPLEPAAINFLRDDPSVDPERKLLPREHVPDPINDPYTYAAGTVPSAGV